MPKKKSVASKETSVRVGNISGVSGNVNVAGKNITTHQTISTLGMVEIKGLFDQLYDAIRANSKISAADKEDLKTEVEEIQSIVTEAVQKNEKVEENFLSRRFRNITRVAPDVLDVIVATLGNPLAGLGVAAKKIAEKAKNDTRNS